MALQNFSELSTFFCNREAAVATTIGTAIWNWRLASTEQQNLRFYKTPSLFHMYGAGKTTFIKNIASKMVEPAVLEGVSMFLRSLGEKELSAEELKKLTTPAITLHIITTSRSWEAMLEVALINAQQAGVIGHHFDLGKSPTSIVIELLQTRPVILAFDEVGNLARHSVCFDKKLYKNVFNLFIFVKTG
jgi:hypothetical protein